MTIKCSFHPSDPAHFQCYDCGSTYCESCISVRDTRGFAGKSRDYFCPVCNIPATHMGVENLLPQFWKKLSAIFFYPLQPVPLIMTLLLAVLGGIFPYSFLAQLFIWVVMMKYAYAVLLATAQGQLKAPAISFSLINENVGQVFKQFIVFALLVFAGIKIFTLGGFPGLMIYAGIVGIALPAIIMLLVVTNSVLRAVNPMLFVPVIFRIGSAYFLMYAFLFFIYSAPATLLRFMPMEVPVQLQIFLTLFVGQLYALIGYHLMGYVLLQYHSEIGYSVDYEFFIANTTSANKATLSKKQQFDTTLSILIQHEKYEEALRILAPKVTGEKMPSVDHSEKFFRLLSLAGRETEASKYRVRHIDVLASRAKTERALELISEIIENPRFGVPSAESIQRIGKWLVERGEQRKAFVCYKLFLEHHKDHADVPEVYFELAKILNEFAKKTDKSKQLLQKVMHQFPEHRLVPEVRLYMSSLG